jgi:hypothetical protein
MPHAIPASPDLINKLPDTAEVRERLSSALREVQLLRQLLRLTENAEKTRERSANHKGDEVCRGLTRM